MLFVFKNNFTLTLSFIALKTRFTGVCGSVSSTGNDLGVWSFKRDGCWTCLSVHLCYPQFASGNVEVFFLVFLRHFLTRDKNHDNVHGQFHCTEVVL